MKQLLLVIVFQVFILRNYCLNLVSNANDKNELTSSMIKFCIGKERINFCSDEHLHMIINFAALHGKSRPIHDLNELEIERQKAIEKQRISNIEREKKRQRLNELKQERQRQIELKMKK